MNNQRIFSVVLILLALFAAPFSYAQDILSSELEEVLKNTRRFEADFEQKTIDKAGAQIDDSFGHVSIERPGRFRWDYFTPYEQMILADGERLWVYDIDLEQVTVRSQKEALAALPASLLSGEIDELTGQFKITVKKSESGMALQLLPVSDNGDLGQLILVLDKQGLPVRMQVFDRLGQKTDFTFSKSRIVEKFEKGHFEFHPPEGVDVLGSVK